MGRKSNFIVLGVIVLAGLLLAACTGASQQVDREPNVDTPPLEQDVDKDAPVENVEVSEGEGAPSPVPPESASADAKPTPRSELNATDPSTVNLATGNPQLFWFFAFW